MSQKATLQAHWEVHFPALLGSLINKSSEPEGASGIMDMVSDLDMGMLGDIGGLFGGGASAVNGLLGSGGGILDSLLGDKLGGVVDLISKVSGLKSGSSSSLLKMAAPFLIGMIGKQIKGKGIGFLTDLLMGQKEHVSNAMPSGMGSLLGLGFASDMLGKAGDVVKDVAVAGADAMSGVANTAAQAAGSAASAATGAASTVAGAGADAAKTGLGWIKWALPLLLIGGLAVWMITGKNPAKGAMDKAGEAVNAVGDAAGNAADAVADGAAAVGDATKDMAGAAADMVSGAFSKVDDAAKAALDKVTFAANSAGKQMMGFY